MIRLFNVYYPVRTLVLLIGEALIVWTSLLLGAFLVFREDFYLVMSENRGYIKIFVITILVLLCSHLFDLYDTARLTTKGELYFRLLMVPGLVALFLAGVTYLRPNYVLVNGVGSGDFSAVGLLILTFALLGWRIGFARLVRLPILVERVYVLGTGERARRLVQGLRQNPDIGIEIVGWSGTIEGAITSDSVAAHLMEAVHNQKIHRVILAMSDRRGTIPTQELFALRLRGVRIEDATSWLEKISGRIEVENLYPSWLLFGEGFRRSAPFMMIRRVLSIVVSLIALILTVPLIPLVMLAIKLDSKGPALHTQRRVGEGGKTFDMVKFRTMRTDAEASGPRWADNNDPRVTRVGKFLRAFRLDDIPQLWCVLKGDMAIVGPRPERQEFVEFLSREIPYYGVRHMVRPGLTGWARIKYGHRRRVEDAREELQYDLFYVKNVSIGLDLMIMFQTIKTVLLCRGA